MSNISPNIGLDSGSGGGSGGSSPTSVQSVSDLPSDASDGTLIYVENEQDIYEYDESDGTWKNRSHAFRLDASSDWIYPDERASESDTVFMIGPSSVYPYHRPYGPHLSESDFSTISPLPSEDSRHNLSYRSITTGGFADGISETKLPNLVTLRVGFIAHETITSDQGYLVAYAESGESESVNYLWSIQLFTGAGDGLSMQLLCETGGGTNVSGAWQLPFLRLRPDQPYIFAFQRESDGTTRAYLDGHRLRRVESTTGTANDDGSINGIDASGGSDSSLNLYRPEPGDSLNTGPWNMAFVHVREAAPGDQESSDYASGVADLNASAKGKIFTSDSVISDLASESGSTLTIVPDEAKSVGYRDEQGKLADSDWASSAEADKILDDEVWGFQSNQTVIGNNSSAVEDLYNVSDLIYRAVFRFNGNTGKSVNLMNIRGDGESLATNGLGEMRVASNSTLEYLHEYESANNVFVDFSLNTTLEVGDIRAFTLRRVDNGDGTCDLYAIVDGSTLSVSSISVEGGSGTDNGDHATVPIPEGDPNDIQQAFGFGHTAQFGSQSSRTLLFGQYLEKPSTITREKDVHDKLGF